MDKRLGTLSIFIYNRDRVKKINDLLSEYNNFIISRMGIPYRDKKAAIIVIIIDATNDDIGALSGKLGNIEGVSVKTALSKI